MTAGEDDPYISGYIMPTDPYIAGVPVSQAMSTTESSITQKATVNLAQAASGSTTMESVTSTTMIPSALFTVQSITPAASSTASAASTAVVTGGGSRFTWHAGLFLPWVAVLLFSSGFVKLAAKERFQEDR